MRIFPQKRPSEGQFTLEVSFPFSSECPGFLRDEEKEFFFFFYASLGKNNDFP